MTTVQPAPTTPLPNRREFLYYLAGGALLLTVGGGVAAISSFLHMGLREGIDILTVNMADLPAIQLEPFAISATESRKFIYLVVLNNGLVALSQICPRRAA